MSSKLQAIRGTKDYIGDDARQLNHIMRKGEEIGNLYGFNPIITPIIEDLAVFKRSLGDTTDVVTKEMYNFTDKGGEDITLRPENTASVVRAFISNGLQQNLPAKFFYAGPMFRYERPQKGRLRQFHQIGVEILGVAQAQADSEVIACGKHILDELGLHGRYTLELNSLGDKESRQIYRQALIDYLTKYKHDLSADSQNRLQQNPLRVLDSKDESDRKIIADAPLLHQYLNNESRQFYDDLCNDLVILGIDYVHTPHLVRGLDYYCHTAFEFTTDELGAQATIMGGGRYDGLVSMLGGDNIAGIGWAAGVERLALMVDYDAQNHHAVSVIPLGDEAHKTCLKLCEQLRSANIKTHIAYDGNIKKRFKLADKNKVKIAIIIGDDEIKNQQAVIKDLTSGEQENIAFDNISEYLKETL